jgi:hypothetical protein
LFNFLMKTSQNILISPLNWGLGHASRIIPIIDYCLKSGKKVILAGNGASIELLKNEYPDLIFIHIPSPAMHYGKKKAMGFSFYFCAFLMALNLSRERYLIAKAIKLHKIDTIISDNRPGIFSRKVKSIYITHQVNVFCSLKGGTFSKLYTKFHKHIIKKYNYCWIPDTEGEFSISGRLSKNDYLPALNYIGPLSRFSVLTPEFLYKNKYDIVCIISGPEPQRNILEHLLIKKFRDNVNTTLIIRGLPESKEQLAPEGNVSFKNHCKDSEFLYYINTAKFIVCRSGYSSVMDLIVTRNPALLIPTPGQPEQEYLAEYLSGKFGFLSVTQSMLSCFDFGNTNSIRSHELFYDKDALKKTLDLHL